MGRQFQDYRHCRWRQDCQTRTGQAVMRASETADFDAVGLAVFETRLPPSLLANVAGRCDAAASSRKPSRANSTTPRLRRSRPTAGIGIGRARLLTGALWWWISGKIHSSLAPASRNKSAPGQTRSNIRRDHLGFAGDIPRNPHPPSRDSPLGLIGAEAGGPTVSQVT